MTSDRGEADGVAALLHYFLKDRDVMLCQMDERVHSERSRSVVESCQSSCERLPMFHSLCMWDDIPQPIS